MAGEGGGVVPFWKNGLATASDPWSNYQGGQPFSSFSRCVNSFLKHFCLLVLVSAADLEAEPGRDCVSQKIPEYLFLSRYVVCCTSVFFSWHFGSFSFLVKSHLVMFGGNSIQITRTVCWLHSMIPLASCNITGARVEILLKVLWRAVQNHHLGHFCTDLLNC